MQRVPHADRDREHDRTRGRGMIGASWSHPAPAGSGRARSRSATNATVPSGNTMIGRYHPATANASPVAPNAATAAAVVKATTRSQRGSGVGCAVSGAFSDSVGRS